LSPPLPSSLAYIKLANPGSVGKMAVKMERESQIQGMEWVFFYSLINIITVVSAKAVMHDALTIQLSSFLVHHIT